MKMTYREAFGAAFPEDELRFEPSEGYDEFVPRGSQDFVFNVDLTRDLVMVLLSGSSDGLFIFGPTGCGKSSHIREVFARLKMPMIGMTCTEATTSADFIGSWVLVGDDGMRWLDGPLTIAVREGLPLVLDEMDQMRPEELVILNGILDGSPLVIPQLGGEVIAIHPRFRLIATGNSNGTWDGSNAYVGVKRQNMAFMDRMIVARAAYMDPEVERMLLEKAFLGTTITSDIIKKAIELANDIRAQFLAGRIGMTFSARSLKRWMRLTIAYHRQDHPLRMALLKALVNRAEPVDQEVIFRAAAALFGNAFGSGDTLS